MIKNNVIYFGYGDIAVSSTGHGYLILQWFEPPIEIGSALKGKKVNWLSDKIRLNIIYKDLEEFNKINENNNQIIIDGYTLDFSNYNNISIKVVRKHIQNALFLFQLALAC
jgi:hypothetical protein